MAERKDRMALLSRYTKLHSAKYGEKPTFNINVEQWSADGLIESYSLQKCYDLLQYYFEVAHAPTWKYFANYAQEIIDKRDQLEKDKLERAERRLAAKRWLSE
jgi:hypothetical protein